MLIWRGLLTIARESAFTVAAIPSMRDEFFDRSGLLNIRLSLDFLPIRSSRSSAALDVRRGGACRSKHKSLKKIRFWIRLSRCKFQPRRPRLIFL